MVNQKHFLTDFKITEFKCFKDFEITGFSQFNIILGGHNVGKTTLLEAMHASTCAASIDQLNTAIHRIQAMRMRTAICKTTAMMRTQLKALGSCIVESNITKVNFKDLSRDAKVEYMYLLFDGGLKYINANDFYFNYHATPNTTFVPNDGLGNDDLCITYAEVLRLDLEDAIVDSVLDFDYEIDKFKFIGDLGFMCKLGPRYHPLSEFGEGLRRYVSILCSICACKNGYLFIDETIDRFQLPQHELIWTNIFQLAKRLNCQLFITTQSRKLLESFTSVAKGINERNVTYTQLIRDERLGRLKTMYDFNKLLVATADIALIR